MAFGGSIWHLYIIVYSVIVLLKPNVQKNRTIGTIKVGSQLNGKCNIAILGCSNSNFCIGDGADKKASTTIFMSSARHMKFQIKIIFRLIFPLAKPKYAIIGAVIPAIISKFRPSMSSVQVLLCFRKAKTIQVPQLSLLYLDKSGLLKASYQ